MCTAIGTILETRFVTDAITNRMVAVLDEGLQCMLKLKSIAIYCKSNEDWKNHSRDFSLKYSTI